MKISNQHILFFSFIFLFFFFNNASLNGYAGESNDRLIPIGIVGPFIVLICFLYIKSTNLKIYISENLMITLSLFFLNLLLISFFRNETISSFRNFASILITYSVVINMSAILHSIDFIKVLNIFVYLISFIILPFNLFIQQTRLNGFAILPDRLEGDTLRFGGALYHAHNGMVLGFIALILIYQILIEKQKTLFNYLLLSTMIFCIILTDCRSVWGGVLLCAFLMFYSKVKSILVKGTVVFLSVLALAVGLINLTNKDTTLISKTGEDLNFRQLIWVSALKGISEAPIIGYGSDSYFEINSFSTEDISDNLNDSHNSFLDLFLQSGVIASFILMFFYFKVYSQFEKTKKRPELYILFVFWIIIPFFWGGIYRGTTGFITFFFPLTIFSIFLHPQLIQKGDS